MIQHIQIYRMGEDSWSMQVNKEGDQSVMIDGISENYPELINDLMRVANSVKTPQEEALERIFQIVEQVATDEQILELADVIPDWEPEGEYKKNAVRKQNDKFYRCLQSHDFQVNREPDVAVSLWVEIGEDEASGEDIINWFEPTANHYFTLGQLMRYTDNNVYESLLAVNTWSPETFASGWKLREDLS